MSLSDRFTPAFIHDALITESGRMSFEWINWINTLLDELNLTFKSGRDTIGVSSTTQLNIRFLVLPPMSTTTRDKQQNPDEGSVIFNTTTKKAQVFTGTAWDDMN